MSDNSSVATLLLFGVLLFYAVGVGVLPSRELLRRGLRGGKPALSAAATWLGPVGLLLAGALATQVVIVALAGQHPGAMPSAGPSQEWFPVLYFTAWVGRDLLFLQWMKVRPGRAPLRKAFLYLLVFYISTSILFRSSFTSALPESAAVPAFLTPLPVLRNWAGAHWDAAFGVLVTALVMPLGAAAFFAYLYRQQVEGLASRPQPSPPTGPARLPSPTS